MVGRPGSPLLGRRQARGVGTGLAQSRSSGLGASAGRPSPCPETSPPSLWGQKPQGRGHWGLPGRKGHRACPLQPASGPWHRSAATRPDTCRGVRRGCRRACWVLTWPTTVMSPLLRSPVSTGSPRPPPSSDPSSEPVPPSLSCHLIFRSF